MKLPAAMLVRLIRLYQLTISPAQLFLFGPSGGCRFEPSCSRFAAEALDTHGGWHGGWLAAGRICRCHPWGGAGLDPVPAARRQPPKTQPIAT